MVPFRRRGPVRDRRWPVGAWLAPTLRWLPAAAYVAANWAASSLPGERVARLPGADELWHAAANAVFGAALRLALGGGRRALAVAAAILAGHGALDEWHQGWVPGREPSVTDWAADVAGGLAGWGLWGLAAARRSRARPQPPP